MRRLILTSFLALAMLGCQAPGEEMPPPGTMDPSDPGMDPTQPQPMPADPGSKVAPPTIDQGASMTTDYLSVPLAGSAPGAVSVVISSPTGDVSAPVVQGKYCASVSLRASSANVLSVRAEDSSGLKSASTQITVSQMGTHPGQTIPATYAQTGADVVLSDAIEHSSSYSLANLLDHDPNTKVEFSSDLGYGGSEYTIRLNLQKVSKVKSITVISPSNCYFGAQEPGSGFRIKYALTATPQDNPWTEPSSVWTELEVNPMGTGTDTVTLPTGVNMGAIAIMPEHNTSICHNWLGEDYYWISDINVMTEEEHLPAVPPACPGQ